MKSLPGISLFLSVALGLLPGSQAHAGAVIAGFDNNYPVKSSYSGKYTCFTGKLVKSYWEYATGGRDFTTWKTARVKRTLSGQKITFRFACGFGVHNGSAEHRLFINRQPLLSFSPDYSDFTAKSRAAELRFTTLYIDNNEDIFGIAAVTVAPEMIKYGEPQTFTMRGSKANLKVWFMLSDTKLISPAQAGQIQKDDKIKRRLEIIRQIKEKEAKERSSALRPRICHFAAGRPAAVSLLPNGEDSADYEDAVTLALNAAASMDHFEEAVSRALKKRQWLLVRINPSARKQLPKIRHYLQQLNFVVWQAPADKVAEYIRMRKQAKLIVEKQSPGHFTVILHGFPSGVKPTIPLTAQVVLPPGAWDIRVVDSHRQPVASQLIAIEKRYGVRFPITPGGGNLEIYYQGEKEDSK